MIIKAFGLFWRADEIEWAPGRGHRNEFRLLGRRGSNLPGLQIADFRDQRGVYILYNNYGPYYAGLTKKQTLGKRVGDHTRDEHKKQWDRFSWFGFLQVLKRKDKAGFHLLRDMPAAQAVAPHSVIGDIEALLIKSMGTQNIRNMNFFNAREWTQIKKDEVGGYSKKASGGH